MMRSAEVDVKVEVGSAEVDVEVEVDVAEKKKAMLWIRPMKAANLPRTICDPQIKPYMVVSVREGDNWVAKWNNKSTAVESTLKQTSGGSGRDGRNVEFDQQIEDNYGAIEVDGDAEHFKIEFLDANTDDIIGYGGLDKYYYFNTTKTKLNDAVEIDGKTNPLLLSKDNSDFGVPDGQDLPLAAFHDIDLKKFYGEKVRIYGAICDGEIHKILLKDESMKTKEDQKKFLRNDAPNGRYQIEYQVISKEEWDKFVSDNSSLTGNALAKEWGMATIKGELTFKKIQILKSQGKGLPNTDADQDGNTKKREDNPDVDDLSDPYLVISVGGKLYNKEKQTDEKIGYEIKTKTQIDDCLFPIWSYNQQDFDDLTDKDGVKFLSIAGEAFKVSQPKNDPCVGFDTGVLKFEFSPQHCAKKVRIAISDDDTSSENQATEYAKKDKGDVKKGDAIDKKNDDFIGFVEVDLPEDLTTAAEVILQNVQMKCPRHKGHECFCDITFLYEPVGKIEQETGVNFAESNIVATSSSSPEAKVHASAKADAKRNFEFMSVSYQMPTYDDNFRPEVQLLFDRWNTDKNEHLEFEEVKQTFGNKMMGHASAKAMFDHFKASGVDDNGLLTNGEFHQYFQLLWQRKVDQAKLDLIDEIKLMSKDGETWTGGMDVTEQIERARPETPVVGEVEEA